MQDRDNLTHRRTHKSPCDIAAAPCPVKNLQVFPLDFYPSCKTTLERKGLGTKLVCARAETNVILKFWIT